jgi:hypothetical protein
MHLKWKWIGLGLLAWGCQVGTSISPQPTPSGSTSPLTPSSQPSGEEPSPTPSPLPEESPSPAPTPTPLPPEVNGLEAYNRTANIFCTSEATTQQQDPPSIENLGDFVVQADGKQMVLLFQQRKPIQVIRGCKPGFSDCLPLNLPAGIEPIFLERGFYDDNSPKPTPMIISRQGIYTLDTQGNISYLRMNNSEQFSCPPSQEMEKDHQGRLLVHMPTRFTAPPSHGNPYRGYRLMEWDLQTKTIRQIWEQSFHEDKNPIGVDGLTSSNENYSELAGLYSVNQQNRSTVYYALNSRESQFGSVLKGSKLEQLALEEQPLQNRTVVNSPNPYMGPFAIRQDGHLIIDFLQAPKPYPLDYPFMDSWNKRPWQPILNPTLITGLYRPTAMRIDSQDNLYFTGNHSLWHVHLPTQTLRRLAGTDEAGYQDGPGNTARFNQPDKLDLDAAGNVYVFDKGNLAIRKVTPSGQVTTFYREPVKP